MLQEQLVRQWNAVHDDFATDPEIVELGVRLRRQGVLAEPHRSAVAEPLASSDDELRFKLLRGLAAALITISLFAGGVATMVASAPGLAGPAHVVLM